MKGKIMITITENAADHIRKFLTKRGKGEGIRIGVKTSGCSGMAYTLEFVDKIQPEDQVFEQNGVKVFIDPKSMVYLDGTQVDFAKDPAGWQFSLLTNILTPIVLISLGVILPLLAKRERKQSLKQ